LDISAWFDAVKLNLFSKYFRKIRGSLLITATTCIFDPDPGDPLIDLGRTCSFSKISSNPSCGSRWTSKRIRIQILI
jgi:hypothetical protein